LRSMRSERSIFELDGRFLETCIMEPMG
jgi:hypothetical protein